VEEKQYDEGNRKNAFTASLQNYKKYENQPSKINVTVKNRILKK
jgi:hypothetical protein